MTNMKRMAVGAKLAAVVIRSRPVEWGVGLVGAHAPMELIAPAQPWKNRRRPHGRDRLFRRKS